MTNTVQKWDNKLDTYLTKIFDSDGVELSGGQWQKVALSRFIYKEAKIYIMDEPSASLDLESEDHIFKTVFQYIQNKTLVLISHRMNNVHNMDKIIVVDQGKISEIGKHNELMKNKGIYFELYNLNLKNYITKEES